MRTKLIFQFQAPAAPADLVGKQVEAYRQPRPIRMHEGQERYIVCNDSVWGVVPRAAIVDALREGSLTFVGRA